MANIVYMARSAWTNLLDTIRSKASVSGTMTVSQATTAVENIPSGGDDERFKKRIEGTISVASGHDVTRVASFAFMRCNSLTAVDFPNVTTIGSSAFFSCSKLQTVNFQNVTYIGQEAFKSCNSLQTISFPNATSIQGSAFVSCKITEAN